MAACVGAVVLAGGRGSRLGGRDKGLIPLGGRPLVAWVVGRLAPQVQRLVVSANRDREAYAALGWPVQADLLPGQPGPLAGIDAAARQLDCEWVLTAPCDTPFLPTDLVARLLAQAQGDGQQAVYVAEASRGHYTLALYQREALQRLPDFLAAGGRSLQGWLTRLDARPVLFEGEPEALLNINTPEDLARAEHLAPRYA